MWVLRDFRVHSGWHGGNPKPRPPWNQKGITRADGSAKPAFREVQGVFARPMRQEREERE